MSFWFAKVPPSTGARTTLRRAARALVEVTGGACALQILLGIRSQIGGVDDVIDLCGSSRADAGNLEAAERVAFEHPLT